MLQSIRFRNFTVFRDATLPLGRFTLVVGPNGSGKSTIFQALRAVAEPDSVAYNRISPAAIAPGSDVLVTLVWESPVRGATTGTSWGSQGVQLHDSPPAQQEALRNQQPSFRYYSLLPNALREPVQITPSPEMGPEGSGLAAVLDDLQSRHPERFDALNSEWGRWLPEFDRIALETAAPGAKSIALRTRQGGHLIPGRELSDGSLLALAILTLAYLPDPPPLVGFEEPDHGVHPRLLRHVQDALYRLAYPEGFGEERDPVQVIATTQSMPYWDLPANPSIAREPPAAASRTRWRWCDRYCSTFTTRPTRTRWRSWSIRIGARFTCLNTRPPEMRRRAAGYVTSAAPSRRPKPTYDRSHRGAHQC